MQLFAGTSVEVRQRFPNGFASLNFERDHQQTNC
jgi:hypothetical protein